ncbi:hypothetical protein ABTE82_19290, partial [Acinetobacter baumannii]
MTFRSCFRTVSTATATLMLAGLAAGTQAADLAGRPYVKAPPILVPARDWSGFYLGANGGWG